MCNYKHIYVSYKYLCNFLKFAHFSKAYKYVETNVINFW
jgi:hypothetical protein